MRKRVSDTKAEIGGLLGTLGQADNSDGKRRELKALRDKLVLDCWQIKSRHDTHFKDAFEGLRNSKEKFCDRVLTELEKNTAKLVGLDALKTRAGSLFDQAVEHLCTIKPIDARDLVSAEAEAVLVKKVVGKNDVDVAALIRRLGNSDWVRQGLPYIEKGGQCPFCQQAIKDDLAARLNAYFDETFLADMADITRVVERYEVHAQDIIVRLREIADSGSRFLDDVPFRADIDRLAARLTVNNRLLDGKKKEPSAAVTLESITEIVASLVGQIETANAQITGHNTLVDNLGTERAKLISEIWQCLLDENKPLLSAFTIQRTGLDKAIQSLSAQIAAKDAQLSNTSAELRELEKKVTSVQPTVDEINGLLTSFGFSGFKLKTAGDQNHLYEIVRDDGGNANETLSEGEKSFVSFLYFFHLMRGSMSASDITDDRVVVFDDPVSSLDSDVLFIVSALMKRAIKEAMSKQGQIKQVFVLTHNIYFHKEVSFNPDRNKGKAFKDETFWIVRKPAGITEAIAHRSNPIKTSYELLWQEVRDPNKATIQNTLRRIIENYFKITGGVDPNGIIERFSGRDQQICSSLLSWLNDGSHSVHEELYVSHDDSMIERYLNVFKRVFNVMGHEAHYQMMMRVADEEVAEAPPAPVAA
jgi:wobble nucleotide-excising tRNase